MRQLTKDDEKVLRRFVDTRHYREVGYDSDKTDLRSFHDPAGQDMGCDQIFKPVGLGPLPPTPPQAPASTGCSRRQGHYSLREKMHLDGLVPCRPTLCRDESDDYAELDDVVGAGMGAEGTRTESDGFDEAGMFLVRASASVFQYASFILLSVHFVFDWLCSVYFSIQCIMFGSFDFCSCNFFLTILLQSV